MPADRNWNITFSQNAKKDQWLAERLRTDIPPRAHTHRPLRILDLGCGCGEGSFLLAALYPQAQILGLDISEANILHGRRALQTRQPAAISFVCGDYSQIRFPDDHFDLIVADGVLHLIPDAARDILSKITDELAPGGHFVFSIPSEGLLNRLLWLTRLMLRRLRSRLTDRLILKIAGMLHRQEADEAFLRERIHYMYMTPTLWVSNKLRSVLRDSLGLLPVCERRYPRASLGKFTHRLCIYSKPASRKYTLRAG